jgi:putative oxidoreductase
MSDDIIDARRLVVPGAAGIYEKFAPYSYTLVRVALGLVLLPHGINKLFFGDALNAAKTMAGLGLDPALAWAYLIGVLEAVGGLLLILGLWTRIVAAAFVIEMAVIAFGVLWPKWWWGQRGMEYVVLMGVCALAIFFRGGGLLSIDRTLSKEF